MIYATTEQAAAYHQARLTAEAWSAIPPDKHAPALQSASDILDSYAHANGGWRHPFTEGSIPEPVIAACCEVALALADTATQERIKAQLEGVKSTSMGSTSESYSGEVRAFTGLITPTTALRLQPYLRRIGGGAPIV